MSKKRNNTKLIPQTKSEVITSLVSELLAPVDTTPLMITAPVIESAPVVSAPVVSAPVVSGEVIGSPNLTSKRIGTTRIDTYRVCNNQRKGVKATHYVQGGFTRIDPQTHREMFIVAVEIPHTDLYSAKTQMVALNAELARERSGGELAVA